MVDIETLTLLYFQNDKPCPYKLECGYILYLYPIKVKNWSIFESSIPILKIDKNQINDINVIKNSYLWFLKNYVFKNDETNIEKSKLANIFYYSMKEKYIYLTNDNNDKPIVILANKDNTIKGVINQKEFNDIIKILLFQNIKNYDDRVVNPEVKELMNDYYKIKYADSKVPSLEEMKTYVVSKNGMSMKKINNMSYRTFSQIYEHALNDVLYIGRKIIQGSYKYKVDGDVLHPLYEKPKDKYEELFTSTDVLANKGIVGTEQLNNLK